MPALENDRLVFRFPQIEKDASFSIDFQRTLRIPDSDRTYPLPPGIGSFPVRHVEDYAAKLSSKTNLRGGVILPIWQAEAMWLDFNNRGPDRSLPFPVALKVAAGKINAVTGETWQVGLHRVPQDYMVSPPQPWLDGFAVARGVVRQFVAMPLGDGFSVEEQLTEAAEWGGLQISVTPLRAEVWKEKRAEWVVEERRRQSQYQPLGQMAFFDSTMGMAAGGKMRQTIQPDLFELSDWDVASTDRVFVTLVHGKYWKAITGQEAPNVPPTAKEYSDAGLPWFEHYGTDNSALAGSAVLARVKSVAEVFKENTGSTMPGSGDVGAVKTTLIRRGGCFDRPGRAVVSPINDDF